MLECLRHCHSGCFLKPKNVLKVVWKILQERLFSRTWIAEHGGEPKSSQKVVRCVINRQSDCWSLLGSRRLIITVFVFPMLPPKLIGICKIVCSVKCVFHLLIGVLRKDLKLQRPCGALLTGSIT